MRPLATDRPAQWFQDVICVPLDHNSSPVGPSSAYRTAWVEFLMRISDEFARRPSSGVACVVLSPLPYAKTTPFATTGGSARFMSREIQAGVSCRPPSRSSSLNAAIAPSVTSPCSTGALKSECLGPQNGANTQRVPFASTQLASAPQMPAEAKLTPSLHKSGVRYRGVRWSSPPMDSVSIRYTRHSLPAETMSSRLLYSKIAGVTCMSRSRLNSHSALDGAK